MIGPSEPFFRIAIAAEEIRLPWAICRNAWNLVDLGLIGHRIGRVRRRRADDEIDLVTQDQLGCDFRRARAARLAILADDLDRIGFAAALKPLAQKSSDLVENEPVRFA